MKIQDLAHKNICILGYGKEGKAMVEALETHAPECEITIADKNPDVKIEGKKHWIQIGDSWLKNLEKFDYLIKSPGIPPLPELKTLRFKLTTPTQIFLDSIAESGAVVIGVTGSKGKSTTSSLIHAILTDAGKRSFLVGNIGEPAIKHLADAKPNTFFVHEFSSYQLMDLQSSPHIAIVTTFFPEHLDYHGSLAAYLDAKKNIARFQTKDDVIVFNAESPEAKEISALSKGTAIGFTESDAPVALDEILLRGRHNLVNIAAAWKVTEHLGIDKKQAVRTIKNFKGLPHRLQSCGIVNGIEWIDDSISTTPETAVAALRALGKSVGILIVGGQNRGYDFSPLAEEVKRSPHLRAVMLLPDSGPTIGEAIMKTGASVELMPVESLEEAVQKARAIASKPQQSHDPVIVLLSPAAPSYGHFKNFEERGDRFRGLAEG